MSIEVPPAPSHESAQAVMARLSRFSREEAPERQSEHVLRQPRMLLIVSCLLSSCGILLLICAIAVICVPDSALSRTITLACEALF